MKPELPEMSSSMCSNDLPVEVISYIMEHLCLADRINASQTCRLWYEASSHNKLHKNEVIFVYDNISRALKYLSPEVPKSTLLQPPFRNFSFRDVEVKSTGEMRHFWPRYGPNMKYLSFQCCEISEKALSDILQLCPKLEILHISGCSELFMSGKVLENIVHHHRMPYLVEIGVMHTRYISDSMLNRFITIAPNLSRIIIDGCYISCNEAVYNRFYPEQKRQKIDSDVSSGIIPLDIASNVLTLQNILNILAVRSEHITAIGLGHTSLNSSGLRNLCKISKKSKLVNLSLSACFQLVNGLDDVAESFNGSLEYLDLSSCCFVSSNSLLHLPKITSLTVVNLFHCQELTDTIIKQFGSFVNLKSLNISKIEQLTGPAILEGLKSLSKLEHLYLNHLPKLGGESLLGLVRTLPPLKTLELEYCLVPVIDEALAVLCERHTSLRRLNLNRCMLMSDIGLTGMGNLIVPIQFDVKNTSLEQGISLACKEERKIVFEAKRKRAIEEHMAPFKELLREAGTEERMGIAKLQMLESLDVSNCPRVTDVSVRHAFKFNQLKVLSLEKNSEITDVSLQSLAIFCPSLQELNLHECSLITDQGIVFLSHLRRIKRLTISGCDRLTNASLEALMKTKAPLKDVEMRQCQKFSRDAVNIFSNWLNHSITWSESIKDYPTWTPPPPPSFPVNGYADC